jgi:hypothetical protein
MIDITWMSLRDGIPSPDFAIGRWRRSERASEGTSIGERTTALTKSSKSEKSVESIESDFRRCATLEAMHKREIRRKDWRWRFLAARRR